jgi:hypothetical protein
VNLLLAAVDVAGPLRWRWELRSQVIAEHRVSVGSGPDSDLLTAFGDLHEYVPWHADPLCLDDEPRIIRKTGIWAKDVVIGEAITATIQHDRYRRPASRRPPIPLSHLVSRRTRYPCSPA